MPDSHGPRDRIIPCVSGLVVLQITLGSVFVLFLDELVTKYGIGSGISLFIAAGVSLTIFGGLVGLMFGSGGFIAIMADGGAEALPNGAARRCCRSASPSWCSSSWSMQNPSRWRYP